jgi:hypothetical protein
VSKDAHFFKQLIYMHFCLHETRDTQYRIPYRAIRWSKGSLGFRENRKVQMHLVTLSSCGWKTRPSRAEVTAYPPTPRLVLNGLKRG